ncbi:MAG TPA: BrnT family toxin [Bryobacteraceae bacterium]
MEPEFEWDPRKAASNLGKHEVSFEEAATVFRDPLGRIVADPRHSHEEERFVLLGISQDQRLLAVMYADRGEAIRIISARRATRAERKDYEKSFQ